MPEDVIVAVASHIQSINKKIKPLQLEIKKAVSEIDGQSYIVLVRFDHFHDQFMTDWIWLVLR